jgi:hypothetical protein
MASINSFVRVPPDSSGKKTATQRITRGADDVEIQEVLSSYQADSTCTGVNITTSSAQALPANLARRGVMLQNLSDTRIICRFSVAAVATTGSEVGFAVEANGGAVYLAGLVDTRILNAVHAGTGNKRLLITEWSG